jgi:hypothetical protein
MSLRTTINTSLMAALISAFSAWVLPHFGDSHARDVFLVSFTLSAVWLGITIYAIVKYHWRGLWMLVGAIPALYWPIALTIFVAGCSTAPGCFV